MSIVRWEPLRELSTLSTEMNRIFANANRWQPSMDLVESGEEYVLRVDLPGVSQEDVRIEVENDVLSVAGERKADHHEESAGYVRLERSFGSFSRTLHLPKGVDTEAIVASFVDGVLTLRIPKPEQAKPRRIPIAIEA